MIFESLKMNEDKNIVECLLKVYDVANMIIRINEELKNEVVVQKVLRSLPIRFTVMILAIKEIPNMKALTMEKLHEILIAYEMRIGTEKTKLKETTIKTSKKYKEHKEHQ